MTSRSYFAAQPRQPSPIKLDPAAVERGRAASTQCVVCHGQNGKGDASKNIPDITGQPPGYLQAQMLKFKADTRSPGDPVLKALKTLMATIPDPTLGRPGRLLLEPALVLLTSERRVAAGERAARFPAEYRGEGRGGVAAAKGVSSMTRARAIAYAVVRWPSCGRPVTPSVRSV